jgi:hypothetical protein
MDTSTLILLASATSQVAHNFAPVLVLSPAIIWWAVWGE